MISYVLAALTCLAVMGADQFTKHIVVTRFVLGEEGKVLIPGLIDLIFVKNDGGAWGMLGGSTWLLLSLTIVIMMVCVTLLLKYGVRDKVIFWSISLILAGGLGNMIDRIFRDGFVVDFLHFTFWKSFPVFNVADCAIVTGGAMLVVYLGWGVFKEYRKSKRTALFASAQDGVNDENNK